MPRQSRLRKPPGSISDGKSVERYQFAKARTNNEAEYGSVSAARKSPKQAGLRAKSSDYLHRFATNVRPVNARFESQSEKSLLALHNEAALRLRRTGAKLIWVPRDQIVKQLGH